MKRKGFFCFCTVLVIGGLFCACEPDTPREAKEKEQNKLKSDVEIDLRAADLAYDVEKYSLAADYYKTAIDKGWIDGVDLYQYADCLERLGKTEESKVYFEKSYNELLEFYPNHANLNKLRQLGYGND